MMPSNKSRKARDLSIILAAVCLAAVGTSCEGWIQSTLSKGAPFHSRSQTFRSAEDHPPFMEPDEVGSFGDNIAASSNRRRKSKFATQREAPSSQTVGKKPTTVKRSYNLGVGKNLPLGQDKDQNAEVTSASNRDKAKHWHAPAAVNKSRVSTPQAQTNTEAAAVPAKAVDSKGPVSDGSTETSIEARIGRPKKFVKKRRMVARDQQSATLRGAIWDEEHYAGRAQGSRLDNGNVASFSNGAAESLQVATASAPNGIRVPTLFYPDIDMSIPQNIYNETYDAVWELLQWEAYQEAQREPLLVSFLYSSILNHKSLESSLAFLLANRLSSPMLISTQLQSFILEALESSPDFRRAVRADMLAVRDRDPACTCLPDVFLYFKGKLGQKMTFVNGWWRCLYIAIRNVALLLLILLPCFFTPGFQALQSHRVAHVMWKHNKNVLAHFLQSQVSQIFQIDIHPNATLGSGIMLDHGTGERTIVRSFIAITEANNNT